MNKYGVKFVCSLIPNKIKREKVRNILLGFDNTSNDRIEFCINKLQYIEKLLKSQFDINEAIPAKGNLLLIQKSAISILSKFAQIAKNHNLKFWLDSGSLIGYVRHNGFIPWDDDIDIAMIREDYEKLPNILSEYFENDGFFFRIGEITRLYYKNLHIWIDIFPMDKGYSEIPLIGEEYDNFIDYLNKIKSKTDFDYNKWLKHEKPVSDKYLQECFKERDTQLVKERKDKGFIFYGVETGAKDRTLFKYDCIYPLKPITYYGIPAYIPNNTNEYLQQMYGDYMCYPHNFKSAHGESFSNSLNYVQYQECEELINKYYPYREEQTND